MEVAGETIYMVGFSIWHDGQLMGTSMYFVFLF